MKYARKYSIQIGCQEIGQPSPTPPARFHVSLHWRGLRRQLCSNSAPGVGSLRSIARRASLGTLQLATVYHQPVEYDDVTAFILAGGKSARMGQDKALLSLAGQTLLSRALVEARLIAPKVFIVGDPAKFAGFGAVIADIYPGRGPLGGIHAALMSTNSELNLMMAVDTPFIPSQLFDFLIGEARSSDAVVTVPRIGGFMHPLCAVYRREFARVSEQALILGQNKIDSLFTEVKTRVVEEAELLQMGFQARMFRNLNTPEELKEAQLKEV